MELTPLSHSHIDRRLQDIDRQINSALRDIRRNLEELEQATGARGDAAEGPRRPGNDFAGLLRDAMGDEGAGD